MNAYERIMFSLLALFFSLQANIYAETQFLDGFDGSTIDENIWQYPTGDASFYGRTQIRPSYPEVSDGILRLQIDTYNPTGYSFYGSEIYTKGKAKPGTGLSVEIRARLANPVPNGVVGGLFLYDFFPSTGYHSEVDFELLSNMIPDTVQTNIYNNEQFGRGDPEFHKIPDLDVTQFNTYRIEWKETSVRWFINNRLVREKNDEIPKEPLGLHLNFWAPSCDWVEACNPNLLPASKPKDNKTYNFEIDYVRAVFDLNPATECLFSWAEWTYNDLFSPTNVGTRVWSTYTYRYYEDTDTYLAVSALDNHVYYITSSDPIVQIVQNVGALSYWLNVAGCTHAT